MRKRAKRAIPVSPKNATLRPSLCSGQATSRGLPRSLAAQRTLGNFVAGILIAFTQPLRLGDQVEVVGTSGTVEEIRLTYTVLRAPDGARIFVPNDRLG